MRPNSLLLVAGLLLALAISIVPGTSQAQPLGAPPVQSGADLLAAVNSLRASNGLPPYAANPILMQIAQAQADYMAATGGANGHSGPGGTRPIDRAIAAGYPAAFFSENWQAGSDLAPSGAVSAWQGDAPHLNTMLSAQYVDGGGGASKSGSVIYYVLDVGSIGATSPSSVIPGSGTTTSAGAVSTTGPSQFIVPVTVNTPGTDGLVYHEVAYGQTLWSIAIAYGVKIEDIKSLNNLSGLDIYPGQKLLILRGPTPVPASATTGSTVAAEEAIDSPPPTEASIVLAVSSVPTAVVVSTPAAQPPEKKSLNLTVIAIIGAALVFAGLGTWAGTRRSLNESPAPRRPAPETSGEIPTPSPETSQPEKDSPPPSDEKA